MTAAIPTTEPKQVTAGDTVQWKIQLDDYPANDGWVLKYVLTNSTNKFSFTAGADGALHYVNKAPTDTDGWIAGTYEYQALVTKGAERRNVRTGSLTVVPNFDAQEGPIDRRSWAKRTLDNIEAVIENRATKDQEEYSIEGRSLKRTPIADLLTLRDKFKRLYEQEVKEGTAASSLYGRNRVYVRF